MQSTGLYSIKRFLKKSNVSTQILSTLQKQRFVFIIFFLLKKSIFTNLQSIQLQ